MLEFVEHEMEMLPAQLVALPLRAKYTPLTAAAEAKGMQTAFCSVFDSGLELVPCMPFPSQPFMQKETNMPGIHWLSPLCSPKSKRYIDHDDDEEYTLHTHKTVHHAHDKICAWLNAGVSDNRVQNVVITLDKVRLCLQRPGIA